jgi:hypothetical protein
MACELSSISIPTADTLNVFPPQQSKAIDLYDYNVQMDPIANL